MRSRLVNCAGLPPPWPLVIRVVGLLVASLLIVGLVLVVRKAPPPAQAPASGWVDRRYWLIVVLEGSALLGGLVVIKDLVVGFGGQLHPCAG